MSTIKVVSMTGAEVGTVELNDAIFGVEPNMSRCPRSREESPGQLPSGHPERSDPC